jgi:hypothetical protein
MVPKEPLMEIAGDFKGNAALCTYTLSEAQVIS